MGSCAVQVLALLLAVGGAVANLALWETDVKHSLASNIVGCAYRQVMVNTSIPNVDKDDEFVVRPMYPTKHELRIFQSYPIALTEANQALLTLTANAGLNHAWAAMKGSRSDLPVDHIGQNRNACLNMTALAASEKVVNFYEAYKHTQRGYYVMHGRKALVHPTGSVALSCGYFIGSEGCESKTQPIADWHSKCQSDLSKAGVAWSALFANQTPSTVQSCLTPSGTKSPSTVTRHARVFTIAAPADNNYHHFLVDSLVKLSRNLRFLGSNPDVMVHIRAEEDYLTTVTSATQPTPIIAKKMRVELLRMLGIDSSRIISGVVLADDVFVPRAMKCSTLLSNPSELRLLSKQLATAANHFVSTHEELRSALFDDIVLSGRPALKGQHLRSHNDVRKRETHPVPAKSTRSSNVATTSAAAQGSRKLTEIRTKRIVIYQKYTSGPSTATVWTNATTQQIAEHMQAQFPDHKVVVLSSIDADKGDHCLPCELVQYGRADILVAAHESGLTNMLFFHPGSVVVEVVGSVSAAHMPVCGYFGPMAAALGLHHYIFAYDHAASHDIGAQVLATKVAGFVKKVHDPVARASAVKVAAPIPFSSQ